ncbi:hypothetical protein [Flavobacterium rhizosphaerae]|uniref:Uncharacterized protein n=1 Tax=Flavobacterium rhizosphaerae TaxID=3163298 RepID=A0ABW8Z036_9FLAO
MDVRTTLVLLYPDGTAHTFADFTVKQLLISRPAPVNGNDPLAILRPNIGTHLYYNANVLEQYRKDATTYNELLAILHCLGLYRNTTVLKTGKHDEIERGNLWLLRDGEFHLVDDDRSVICVANDELFEKIA